MIKKNDCHSNNKKIMLIFTLKLFILHHKIYNFANSVFLPPAHTHTQPQNNRWLNTVVRQCHISHRQATIGHSYIHSKKSIRYLSFPRCSKLANHHLDHEFVQGPIRAGWCHLTTNDLPSWQLSVADCTAMALAQSLSLYLQVGAHIWVAS